MFLLAFAGIPLTSGFISKFAVFQAAAKGGAVPLVIIGVIGSAIAAYFYVRVIVLMFFTEPHAEQVHVVMPSFWSKAAIAVCAAVTKPVNFMAGIKGKSFTVRDLAAAGVKRVSLATSLFRAAMTGLLTAATEVKDHGTFNYLDTTMPTPDWNRFMTQI